MNTPLANDTVGATLSYSSPPEYSGMTFIGAIANARPSDIFHTSWSLNPNVNQLTEVKLVVQIQPLADIETQVTITQETQIGKNYANLVAENLFNFLMSFDQDPNMAQSGMMVVPQNSLSRWMDKFKQKYDRDPNFIFKTQSK